MKIDKSEVKIIEYKDEYKKKYKELAMEWLNKYNLYEHEDELILNNPDKFILNKGGYIFLAEYEKQIIGTVSLIPDENKVFELAKLAVTKKYQNNGIAKVLIEKAIEMAKKEEAKKILLYSNTKLDKAYHLYKKYGFKEINLNKNKYETANLKMELNLY
ncbi:MAG TPA: GNAT family N-acetyltransferase [Halanaerobiales bacterium]|nr:GNAT family N-acetyltransferase [Halanaerobiales bacterium]